MILSWKIFTGSNNPLSPESAATDAEDTAAAAPADDSAVAVAEVVTDAAEVTEDADAETEAAAEESTEEGKCIHQRENEV